MESLSLGVGSLRDVSGHETRGARAGAWRKLFQSPGNIFCAQLVQTRWAANRKSGKLSLGVQSLET